MSNAELYTSAGNIIKIAMGKVRVGRGRKARNEWAAEQDPLAFVCGIEAIISLVSRAALNKDLDTIDPPLIKDHVKGVSELVEQSKARLAAMSEDERQAMWKAQRESFARAMTTPCEHGVLDFEQCSECRDTMSDILRKQSQVRTLRPAKRRTPK